jgi:ABC-type multidrug transport system fused ATPase/permease subunit
MKLVFRKILYVVVFYLLLFILSCFLLTFAIIYDFLIWLIEKFSKQQGYLQQSTSSSQKSTELNDKFYRNTIQELAQKLRS